MVGAAQRGPKGLILSKKIFSWAFSRKLAPRDRFFDSVPGGQKGHIWPHFAAYFLFLCGFFGFQRFKQPKKRLAALRTLEFSREIGKFQFILVLVDYNPNSSKLDLQRLRDLPFADQIKVFNGGFAMWQQNVTPLEKLEV